MDRKSSLIVDENPYDTYLRGGKRKVPESVYLYPDSTLMREIERGRYWQCATCGSAVADSNQIQHDNFHKTFTNRSDGNMSAVLWCDLGNHAFKAGMPGSAQLTGTITNDEGRQETVTQDSCAVHNYTNYNSGKVTQGAIDQQATANASDELNQIHPYL